MDNFVIVVGDGWIDVPDAHDQVLNNIGVETLRNSIHDSSWSYISQIFQDQFEIPPGKQLINCRMVEEESIHVWFLLGDI